MIFKKIKKDKQNFDRNNTDENKVLNAKYFSAYKGKLVIKMAGFYGRSFYLGAMFISPKETGDSKYSTDVVRHEYGHSKQIERIGVIPYFFMIGIPSVFNRRVPVPDYYNLKTEITADLLGGVVRDSHTEDAIQAGEKYLNKIEKAISPLRRSF